MFSPASNMASYVVAAVVRHTPAQSKERRFLNQEMAFRLSYFLAGVFGLCAVVHWTSKVFRYLSPARKATTDIEGSNPAALRRSSLRRFPAAVAAALRVISFRLYISTGLGVYLPSEMSFIAAYMAVTFSLLFVKTNNLEVWYWERRAGQMANIQLPIIVALAGKNNVISWLTGISHEKLNVLHRATSRTFCILIWVHFFGEYYTGLHPGSWDEFINRMGAVSMGAFTLALLLSLRPVRNLAFELFLISHIILILIALVGAYYHAPRMTYYVWPAFVVWGFDRLLRVGRILVNNTIWRGTDAKHSHGVVELVSEDTIRLTLTRPVRWTAGQHAYILLPSVSRFPTEAHPFTIATIAGGIDGSAGSKEKEIVFLVRTRAGFTGRMKKQAKSGKFSVPAYMDGPYGSPPDLSGFSTCMLVAGGSGVSYTMPLLSNLVHLANADKTSVRRVVFIWAIRSREHMAWIEPMLAAALDAAPRHLVIELKIYVTSVDSTSVSDGKETSSTGSPVISDAGIFDEKTFPALGGLSAMVRFNAGRPDVSALLREEIDATVGPVSVDVCGPESLANSVRSALRSEGGLGVLQGRAPVTLHVETFGM